MTDDEDAGNNGSSEPASARDLTAADIELIHTLVDDLSEDERDQLGQEAEAGGGPLTERLKATVMLAINRGLHEKSASTSG